MASQAYYDGDWYECVSTTAPGESPASHPSKWVKLPIPAAFSAALVSLAVAGLQEGEGQTDKAARNYALGSERLSAAIGRNRDEGDFAQATVMTR